MKVKRERSFEGALVVDVDRLRRIWRDLLTVGNTTRIDVALEDGTVYQFGSLDEMLAETRNSRGRSVQRITLMVRSTPTEVDVPGPDGGRIAAATSGGDYAIVELGQPLWRSATAGMSLELSVPPPLLEDLFSKIAAWAEDSRPWYAGLSRVRPGYLAMAVVGLPILTVLSVLLARGTLSFVKPSDVGGWLVLNLVGGLLLPSLLFGAFLRKVQRYFFPLVAFSIGEGRPRHESMQGWRSLVGGGVLLSLVVEGIAAWLYS